MAKRAPGRIKTAKVTRIFSAGGVVYKNINGEILWLVTKSTPSKLFPKPVWRLPKGWLDDNGDKGPGLLARGDRKASESDLQSTAIKEVKEEGGVEAKIVKKIATERRFFTQEGQRILKFITYYLAQWTKDVSSGFGPETSEVAWLSYKEVFEVLAFKGEKEILKKAKDILDSSFLSLV